MNEQRNMKKNYLAGVSADSLQRDWDELYERLKTLAGNAHLACRPDLETLVLRQMVVVQKNQPNKKIYRSILKFEEKMKTELNSKERIR